jgi:thioesterase domain-containing protein
MRLELMEQRHLTANHNYLPKKYTGKVTMFRATESLEANPEDHPLSWKYLADGGYEHHIIEGTHNIVDEKYTEIIGTKFRDCLERARLKQRRA